VILTEASDGRASDVESTIFGLTRLAERLGYTSVWAGDSVLAKPRLDPLTTLSAAAVATESVQLGTAVYLPTLRHPATAAHQSATVDLLSNGRFEFGVGVGTGERVKDEYTQLELPYAKRGRALDETLDIVTELWKGDPVEYDGRLFELSGASIGFQPAHTPPIHIASSAFDPDMGFPSHIGDRFVEHAAGWLPLSVAPDVYEQALTRIRALVAEAGGDPDRIDPMYYQDVVVADSEREALEEAHDFLADYGAVPRGCADEEYPFADRGAFGPPETIRAHLDRYRDAGVERFVTRFPSYDQETQLRRYAEVVD
jgi:alkanesulfonate monooxygenase SsuD/methylene tetrahydromethanopterin reductase-like flavin-dependent oxidoreductase (luciferase family)